MHPAGDVVESLLKVFPDRDGGVDGADASTTQAVVDGGAIPVADVEPVYDDRLAIHVGFVGWVWPAIHKVTLHGASRSWGAIIAAGRRDNRGHAAQTAMSGTEREI